MERMWRRATLAAAIAGALLCTVTPALLQAADATVAASSPASADPDDGTKNGVVKVFATSRRPDLTKPWSKQSPQEVTGSGAVIDGNPDKVTDVTDVWTFARDVTSRDPNWKLVATEAGH